MKTLFTALILTLATSAVLAEDYRSFEFSIVRTFHKPIKMTVTAKDGQSVLRIRIWSGKGGYDWGDVESDKTRKLTAEEVEQISKLVLPLDLKELKKKEDYLGLDGSTWELAFSKESSVSLWTPGSSTEERKLTEFVALGDYMWKLSGAADPKY